MILLAGYAALLAACALELAALRRARERPGEAWLAALLASLALAAASVAGQLLYRGLAG